MPLLLPGIDNQGNYVGSLNGVRALLAAKTSRVLRRKVDCSRVSFIDCGRLMPDIVLGVVCGTTTGPFVAVLGEVPPPSAEGPKQVSLMGE